MPARRRGYCPVCEKEISVKVDGTANHHGRKLTEGEVTLRGLHPVKYDSPGCPGTGLTVKRFVGVRR